MIYNKNCLYQYWLYKVMKTQSPFKAKFQSQTSVQFFNNLEQGDLCFAETIQNAVLILGFTKRGKTTLTHYLANNPLIGRIHQGQHVYQLSTSRNSEAAIGNHCRSETLTPNIILTRIQQLDAEQRPRIANITLIDGPGYCDSVGSYKLLADNHYKYRIFSKVKNIKFVLALSIQDFFGTAWGALKTLQSFIHTFRDYASIRRQILQATTIVITKYQTKYGVSERQTRVHFENLVRTLFQSYHHSSQFTKECIGQLLNTIIEQKRFFYMTKSQPNIRTQNNKLLETICCKAKYWKRDISNPSKQIDMRHIIFTLRQQLFEFHLNQCFQQLIVRFDNLLDYNSKRSFELFSFNHNRPNLGYVLELFLVNVFSLIAQQEIFYYPAVESFKRSLGQQMHGKEFSQVIKEINKGFGLYGRGLHQKESEVYSRRRQQCKQEIANRYPHTVIDSNPNQPKIQMLEIAKMILRLLSQIQASTIDDMPEISESILQILVQFKKMRFFHNISQYLQYTKQIQSFYYTFYRIILEDRVLKQVLTIQNDDFEDRMAFGNQLSSHFRCYLKIKQELPQISYQIYQNISITDYLQQQLQK